ncbi:hypothetical protein SRHO_G00077430 [Serrasalmus rhombeus]
MAMQSDHIHRHMGHATLMFKTLCVSPAAACRRLRVTDQADLGAVSRAPGPTPPHGRVAQLTLSHANAAQLGGATNTSNKDQQTDQHRSPEHTSQPARAAGVSH